MDASVTKTFEIKQTLDKKKYELYLLEMACRGNDEARELWRRTFTGIKNAKITKK